MTKSAKKSLEEIIKLENSIEKSSVPVVIFFADLIGSTWFKAVNDISSGLKRTLVHNEIISECIINHDGKIIKYIGDEVMATFEKPLNAVNCAISAQKLIQKESVITPLESKMGIHYGDVYYFKYKGTNFEDPQGSAVDFSARLVGNAKPNQILVSENIAKLVCDQIELSPPVSIIPKGFSTKTKIYDVRYNKQKQSINQPPYISYIPSEAEEILSHAKEERTLDNSHEAMMLAKQVLKFDENNTEANYILAASEEYQREDNLDQTIKSLRVVLRNLPCNHRAKHFLAYSLWEKSEEENNKELLIEAVDLTREAIKLSKINEDRHTQNTAQGCLAYYLSEIGGEENCKEALELCIATDKYYFSLANKKYSDFLDTFGFVYQNLGMLEKAKEKYSDAIKLDPENDYAFSHHGEVLRMAKIQKTKM